MQDDIIVDLKQFIATTVSRQTSELRDEINSIKDDIKKLDTKIDDLSGSVAEVLTKTNDNVDEQLTDRETRITQLESQAT